MKFSVLVVVLCVFAAALAPTVRAATITVTLTGNVDSGTDGAGSLNVFNVGTTNLSGQPFTLIYTYDDTQGVTGIMTCTDGTPYYSVISQLGTSNPGTATLKIGASGNTFTFGGGAFNQSEIFSYANMYTQTTSCGGESNAGFGVQAGYAGTCGTCFNGDSTVGPASGSDIYPVPEILGSLSSSFDWRTTISPAVATTPTDTIGFSIAISQGYPSSIPYKVAYGDLSPSYLSVSGQSCSTTPSLSLDSTTYPNILQYGETTTLVASVSPAASVSVGLTSPNNDGTFPASVTTGPITGTANVVYTGGSVSVAADALTAFACGGLSSAVNVYDYNTTNFNIHQSNVSDATFTGSWSVANIQTFLSGKGTFLANFYFDNNSTTGWWDNTGTGTATETYTGASNQIAYCTLDSMGNRTICPAINDPGQYAAQRIFNKAYTETVNPKLLITKLQVENSLISQTTMPSNQAVLDGAEGCPTTGTPPPPIYPTFIDQLGCAATTFRNKYNAASGFTWPYFWQVSSGAGYVGYASNIKLSVSATCPDKHSGPVAGCPYVGFNMNNAATYAQYRYTPYVQVQTGCAGGVCLFETVWHGYGW